MKNDSPVGLPEDFLEVKKLLRAQAERIPDTPASGEQTNLTIEDRQSKLGARYLYYASIDDEEPEEYLEENPSNPELLSRMIIEKCRRLLGKNVKNPIKPLKKGEYDKRYPPKPATPAPEAKRPSLGSRFLRAAKSVVTLRFS